MINIKIQPNQNFADVALTKEGKSSSKKIPLTSLFETFQSLVSAEKDTGYLFPNLLREVVKKASARAYYFPVFTTTFQYTRSCVEANKKNEYGITTSGRTLMIPGFVYRNILGFIANSNTESFNSSFYQVYSVLPNVFGQVDDSSRLVRFFPNQFGSKICWPDDFDKSVLSNRQYNIQASYVPQYLSSKFNTDLFETTIQRSKLSAYSTELDKFFKDVFNKRSEEYRSEDYIGWSFLVYYFLSTVKQIDPAVFCDTRHSLGELFQQYS